MKSLVSDCSRCRQETKFPSVRVWEDSSPELEKTFQRQLLDGVLQGFYVRRTTKLKAGLLLGTAVVLWTIRGTNPVLVTLALVDLSFMRSKNPLIRITWGAIVIYVLATTIPGPLIVTIVGDVAISGVYALLSKEKKGSS